MMSGTPHLAIHCRTNTLAHAFVFAASPCIVIGNASGQPVHLSITVGRVFFPSHAGFNGPTRSTCNVLSDTLLPVGTLDECHTSLDFRVGNAMETVEHNALQCRRDKDASWRDTDVCPHLCVVLTFNQAWFERGQYRLPPLSLSVVIGRVTRHRRRRFSLPSDSEVGPRIVQFSASVAV